MEEEKKRKDIVPNIIEINEKGSLKVLASSKTSNSILQSSSLLFASISAGLIARICTHPMDTVRARLQVQKSGAAIEVYRGGALSTAKTIAMEEGFKGLYKGLNIAMLFSIPAVSAYLTTYDATKSYVNNLFGIPKNTDTFNPWTASFAHLTAAIAAESVSGIFWTPMEVIKQRMQVTDNDLKYKKTVGAMRTVWKQGGFFKGYATNLAVFAPYSMIYFLVYERSKELAAWFYLKKTKKAEFPTEGLPFHMYIICSACSGALASLCVNPLDVVKTRWQVQDGSSLSNSNYKGPIDIMKRMYKEEGISSFKKGMSARVLWAVPTVTITMSCYEQFKKFMSQI